MTTDRLGGAVNHDVGAEFERTLQQRGGERVVDDTEHSSPASGCAQSRQVGNARQRIARRLQPQDAGAVTSAEDRFGVGDVDEANLRMARLAELYERAANVHVDD